MIEIKEVSKIYDLKNRKVVAVDNVSLSINDGEMCIRDRLKLLRLIK